MAHDPTTAAIADQIAERERLRAEVERLTKIVDGEFEKGYDQAVREIRDHFEEVGNGYIVAVIEQIFGKVRVS
jgi:phage gp36-like protein